MSSFYYFQQMLKIKLRRKTDHLRKYFTFTSMPHHSREKDVEDVAVEDVAVEDDVAAEAE